MSHESKAENDVKDDIDNDPAINVTIRTPTSTRSGREEKVDFSPQAPAFASLSNGTPAFASLSNGTPAFASLSNGTPAFAPLSNGTPAFASLSNEVPRFGQTFSASFSMPAYGPMSEPMLDWSRAVTVMIPHDPSEAPWMGPFMGSVSDMGPVSGMGPFVGQGPFFPDQAILDQILQRSMQDTELKRNPDVKIDLIPRHSRSSDLENECTICSEKFKLAEKIIELPCKHIFHFPCIEEGAKYNAVCPLCRKPIPVTGA